MKTTLWIMGAALAAWSLIALCRALFFPKPAADRSIHMPSGRVRHEALNTGREGMVDKTLQQADNVESPTEALKQAGTPAPAGKYEFDIVGESYCQAALESIAGPKGPISKEFECFAIATRERNNRHDPNALVVRIDKKKVGYISRRDNKRLIAELGDEGFPLTVPAIIVGGWKTRGSEGSFGVRLALPENSPPASQKDRAMVKYVEGKLPRGLTQNQVKLKVKQWNKSLDDRYIQWESLQEVIEHLQSADGREEFEIKKPSAAAIQSVFDRLVEEGGDPEDLAFSPDDIVEGLLAENPKLARR